MSLQCSACEQYFNASNFSKSQKKKGDNRRCRKCINDGNWSDNSSVSSYSSHHSHRSNYSGKANYGYHNNYHGGGYRNNLTINEHEEYYPSSDIDENENVNLCRYWNGSPGSCNYGRNCRFRHVQKDSYQNNQLRKQKEAAERKATKLSQEKAKLNAANLKLHDEKQRELEEQEKEKEKLKETAMIYQKEKENLLEKITGFEQKIDDVTKRSTANEEKAVKYQQIVAERDELKQKIQSLENERKEEEARFVDTQYNLQQMTELHEKAEAEKKKLEELVQSLKVKIAGYTENISKSNETIVDLEQKMDETAKRNNELTSRLSQEMNNLKQKNEQNESLNQEQQREINQLQERNHRLEKESNQYQQQYESEKQEYQQQIRALNNTNSQLKQTNDENKNQMKDLEDDINQYRMQCDSGKIKISRLENELKKLTDNAANKSEKMAAENERLRDEIAALQKKLEEQQMEYKNTEKSREIADALLTAQTEEVKEDQIVQEKEVLQSAVVDLGNETEELQALTTEQQREIEQLKEETKENVIIRKTETELFHSLNADKQNTIDGLRKEIEQNQQKIEKTESQLFIVSKERDIAEINLEIEVLRHKHKNMKNKRKIDEKLKEIKELKAEISGLETNIDFDRDTLENNIDELKTERDELMKATAEATKEAQEQKIEMMAIQMEMQSKLLQKDREIQKRDMEKVKLSHQMRQKSSSYKSVPSREDHVKIVDGEQDDDDITVVGVMDSMMGYFTENYPVEAGIFSFYAGIAFLFAMVFSDERECIFADKIISTCTFCAFLLIPPIYRVLTWYYLEEGLSVFKLILDIIARMFILAILMLTADLRPLSCYFEDAFILHLSVVAVAVFCFLLHTLIKNIFIKSKDTNQANGGIVKSQSAKP